MPVGYYESFRIIVMASLSMSMDEHVSTIPKLVLLRTRITKALKSVKPYYLITLISHNAQLLLTQVPKVYCFRPGPRIFFKYARQNSRCLMMEEVSLEM